MMGPVRNLEDCDVISECLVVHEERDIQEGMVSRAKEGVDEIEKRCKSVDETRGNEMGNLPSGFFDAEIPRAVGFVAIPIFSEVLNETQTRCVSHRLFECPSLAGRGDDRHFLNPF